MSYTLPAWANEPAHTSAMSAENFGLLNAAINDLDSRATTVSSRLDVITKVHNVGNSGSSLTIDASSSSGVAKLITLTANCTFAFSGATAGSVAVLELVIKQDATGNRVVTWPASVKWSGGAATLSSGPNNVDRVILVSYDGGTTWYADLIGKAYA